MNCFVGIDLGSTTTKAVVLDENDKIIGRGITNSRSNYDVAAAVVREEAFVGTRFRLTEERMREEGNLGASGEAFLAALQRNFRKEQHLDQLTRLRESMHHVVGVPRHKPIRDELNGIIDEIADEMEARSRDHFARDAERKSDFFRDLAAADFMQLAEEKGDPKGVTFETISSVFEGHVFEGPVAAVSVQLELRAAGEQEIFAAVAIDIAHRNARGLANWILLIGAEEDEGWRLDVRVHAGNSCGLVHVGKARAFGGDERASSHLFGGDLPEGVEEAHTKLGVLIEPPAVALWANPPHEQMYGGAISLGRQIAPVDALDA